MRRATALVAVTVGVVLLAATATTAITRGGPDMPASAGGAAVGAAVVSDTDALAAAISAAQATLEESPQDWETWAKLGAAYVEQARVTADPSYYPRAEGALGTSLEVESEGNYQALAGQGALANARHEFDTAAELARASQEINPAGATSWGVLADALIQTGDYDGATAAVQQMLDLRPGVSSFTRGSYDLELHGRTDDARALLERALASAISPADVAFCRFYLGQLAFSTGDLDAASEQFSLGLAEVAGDPTLLLGEARVAAARGEADAAVAGYQRVVELRPLPEYLVEYGQLLESLGRDAEAQVQYDLFGAVQQIFASNGVQDSLTGALLAGNQGDAEQAVALAEQEWALRENIDSADAMAWALHVAGRDAEALPYAEQATALGTRNASFLYHRGEIEKALGMDDEARATLGEALAVNPYFSPVLAPRAQAALAELGGPA